MTAARKTSSIEDFEAKYRASPDPWGYLDSWYEQRKYAITMAVLPRQRYRLVWEPACSIGVLTGLLAVRSDRVLASDGSPTAIEAARRRDLPAEAGQVDWSVLRLPERPAVEPGAVDLVVLSEILYYLDQADRLAVLEAAHTLLAPGGDLVVVHWRPFPDDAHLSGADVNAWVRAEPGWSPLVRQDDEQFVIDVLRRS